jgi:N6-adenosine-specific RNA methylase IME4
MTAYTGPITDLPMFRYRTLLIDPPWRFKTYSAKGQGKSASAHYDTMSIEAIKALSIGHLAAPNATAIVWGTAPNLMDAIEALATWGFTYKTMGAWAKQSSTGRKWAFGGGYILRSAMEPFLVGTIGHPPTKSKETRNLIVSPVREHSRKPDDQYSLAEAIGHPPYIEVFSRNDRPGWDCWGDEAGKFATEKSA